MHKKTQIKYTQRFKDLMNPYQRTEMDVKKDVYVNFIYWLMFYYPSEELTGRERERALWTYEREKQNSNSQDMQIKIRFNRVTYVICCLVRAFWISAKASWTLVPEPWWELANLTTLTAHIFICYPLVSHIHSLISPLVCSLLPGVLIVQKGAGGKQLGGTKHHVGVVSSSPCRPLDGDGRKKKNSDSR